MPVIHLLRSAAGRALLVFVLPAAAMLCSLSDPAQADPGGSAPFAPHFKPTLSVPRTSLPIRIEGELDDPGWRDAAHATGFAEVSPGDQVKPPVESEAWVTYDDRNLYIALIAFDDPEEVRASVCERDNIWHDDYFGIMLDTYGDQNWGYEIFVNPIGIQGDLRMRSSGEEDITFDLIWESRGRVTDKGYQVEIAIPFASLRFPDRSEQQWRVNFWRDHQRDLRRRYAWSAQDRDNPCFLCQWGYLEGIADVHPGRNTELIVSAVGKQTGEFLDSDDPLSFDNRSPSGESGANLRYALSTSASAEFTVNPDFSQVESDAGIIDVNSTFALFYPERRPFFQEGSDLYETPISAVYTRSINNPDVAGKISGRFGKTSALFLSAHDDESPLIIPLEELGDYLEQKVDSYSNILRVKQSLRDESYVGLLATDRHLDGGGSGTVLSVDALARVRQNYRLELQAAVSHTKEPDDTSLTSDLVEYLQDIRDDLTEPTFAGGKHTVAFDGESFWGHGLYASFERSARTWNLDINYSEYEPRFRTDNGFTTRNDFRHVDCWTGLFFQPNKRWLIQWQPSVGLGRVWSYDNRFKDEWLRPGIWMDTRGQTEFGVEYLMSKERFGPGIFPGIRITSFWFNTRFSEMFGGGFSGRIGRGIYRDFEAPELARQRNWSVYTTFKPCNRLEIQSNFDYARMDKRETKENLFSGYILRNRFNLNFSREWLMRLVIQYNDFNDRIDFEPLLTYRLNPFTVFYVGAANKYLHYDKDEFDFLDSSEWKASSRQYFAKLQYLFRL